MHKHRKRELFSRHQHRQTVTMKLVERILRYMFDIVSYYVSANVHNEELQRISLVFTDDLLLLTRAHQCSLVF